MLREKLLLFLFVVCVFVSGCSSSKADATKTIVANQATNETADSKTSEKPLGEPITMESFYLERELKEDREKFKNRVLILEYAELVAVEADSLKIDNGLYGADIICQGDFSGESWEKVKAKVNRIKAEREKGKTDVVFPKIVIKGVYEKGGIIGDDIILKNCSFVRADES